MPSYSIPIRADLEPKVRLIYALDVGTPDDVRLALSELEGATTFAHLGYALTRYTLGTPDERMENERLVEAILRRGAQAPAGYLEGEWAALVGSLIHRIDSGQPGAPSAPCRCSSSQKGA